MSRADGRAERDEAAEKARKAAMAENAKRMRKELGLTRAEWRERNREEARKSRSAAK